MARAMPVLPEVDSRIVGRVPRGAVPLRLLDHPPGDAVLDRAGRVLALELGPQADAGLRSSCWGCRPGGVPMASRMSSARTPVIIPAGADTSDLGLGGLSGLLRLRGSSKHCPSRYRGWHGTDRRSDAARRARPRRGAVGHHSAPQPGSPHGRHAGRGRGRGGRRLARHDPRRTAGRDDGTVHRSALHRGLGKGVTQIALLLFGRITADTHLAPLRFTATLDRRRRGQARRDDPGEHRQPGRGQGPGRLAVLDRPVRAPVAGRLGGRWRAARPPRLSAPLATGGRGRPGRAARGRRERGPGLGGRSSGTRSCPPRSPAPFPPPRASSARCPRPWTGSTRSARSSSRSSRAPGASTPEYSPDPRARAGRDTRPAHQRRPPVAARARLRAAAGSNLRRRLRAGHRRHHVVRNAGRNP